MFYSVLSSDKEKGKVKMENTIVKTLIYDKQVRLFFVDNTKLINEILSLNKEINKMLKIPCRKP